MSREDKSSISICEVSYLADLAAAMVGLYDFLGLRQTFENHPKTFL